MMKLVFLSFFLAHSLFSQPPKPQSPPNLHESAVMVVANPGCMNHTIGSGIVVAPDVVVTSAHVIQGSREVQIRKNGKTHLASALIVAPELDLCLIRIPALPFPAVELETDPVPIQGQKVWAVGFPNGIGPCTFQGNITERWLFRGTYLLQTNASITHGSSGGGLFNANGRLVGVTTFALLAQDDLNFCVPAVWIQHLLKRPWVVGPEYLKCQPRELLLQNFLDSMTEDPSNRASWEALSRARVASHPKDPEAWYSLGHSLHVRFTNEATQYGMEPTSAISESAQKAYRKAIELNPDLFRAWNNLGILYDTQGQDELAASSFRMAVQLVEDYGLAWTNLGASLMNLGRYEEASAAFSRGVQLLPDDARSWARLALCEGQMKRWVPAIRHLRVALGLRPMCQEWWLDLYQLCQWADAPSEFKQALSFLQDRLPSFSKEIHTQIRAKQDKLHL